MSSEKREKIRKAISTLYNQDTASIRSVAQTVGVLIYTKRLEREKFLALLKKNDDFDKKMKISEIMKLDLKWWLRNINTVKNPIKENHYSLEIFSDASLTGWGVCCQGKKTRGWWEGTEKEKHIYLLELRAAMNGLKCFAREITNREILLRIDNTTAIAYINRMGGIQFPKLNNLAREIWQWCEPRKIHVFASYINTQENRISSVTT